MESMFTDANEQKGRTHRVFSEREAEYLAENILGRIATVSRSMQPHVVPVVYSFDGHDIFFGGWNLTRSLKFRNLTANNKVAFVADEIVSARPWKVKGVEVRGTAAPVIGENEARMVKITPEKVRSWGLRE